MRAPAGAAATSASALVLVLVLCIAGAASAFLHGPTAAAPCRRGAAGVLRMAAGAGAGAEQPQQQQQPRGSAVVAGMNRRGALSQALALPLLAGGVLSLAALNPAPAQAAAKGASGPSFEETMATLLLAKEVLQPVKRYIEIGQFDPARTNIKYVVNQFRIKKAMERAVLLAFDRDGVDPSKLDDAAEVTAVVDNELTQLDSSVYTQIFIPSDGELNPSAYKYRDQAFGFFNTVIKSIDAVLALASPADLAAADKLAGARLKQVKAEAPFLFKEFAGDFYRPATP